MRLSELNAGTSVWNTFTLARTRRLERESSFFMELKPGELGILSLLPESGSYMLTMSDSDVEFDGQECRSGMGPRRQFELELDGGPASDLDFTLRRGWSCLSEIRSLEPLEGDDARERGPGLLMIRTVAFAGAAAQFRDLAGMEDSVVPVAVDNRCLALARAIGIKARTVGDLCGVLDEMVNIQSKGQEFFVYKSARSATELFEAASVDTGDETDDEPEYGSQMFDRDGFPIARRPKAVPMYIPDEEPVMALIGSGIAIPCVSLSPGHPGAPKILKAGLPSVLPDDGAGGSAKLACGRIKFIDASGGELPEQETRIPPAVAGAIMRLSGAQEGQFLHVWEEYGNVQGRLLLRHARAVGAMPIDLAKDGYQEKAKGSVIFFRISVPKILRRGDPIEIVSELPPYLKDSSMTWEEYEAELVSATAGSGQQNAFPVATGTLEKASPGSNSITVKFEKSMPDLRSMGGSYSLILSVAGDQAQIKRRLAAREQMADGTSANPLLGELINSAEIGLGEGELHVWRPDPSKPTDLQHAFPGSTASGVPNPIPLHPIEPLTLFVRHKIFEHDPTPRQVEAIGVALNTPDIALIQGPPGTGKTTVITAILERINEEMDKTAPMRGRILVSGFQHDAVDNIVQRLSINSLPAIKFGGRKDDASGGMSAVEIMCERIRKQLEQKHPDLYRARSHEELCRRIRAFLRSPGREGAVTVLKEVTSKAAGYLPEELLQKLSGALSRIQSDSSRADREKLIRKTRALRTTDESFKDDGRAAALDLLYSIDDTLGFKRGKGEVKLISDQERSVLEMAGAGQRSDKLYKDLRNLKLSLLRRFVCGDSFGAEALGEEVRDLLGEALDAITADQENGGGVDAVLGNFAEELRDNPEGVSEALEDYCLVYAATVQQSAGRQIMKSKARDSNGVPGKPTYDTVIIDEAARCAPNDLMIPMAMAEKRIILVGDHRQLPHIIDDEVAEELMEQDPDGEGKEQVEVLKESMFKHLFELFRNMERAGAPRRTVTLDAQYRTHPVLGKFLSRNFYEIHDPSEGFRSPLPAKFYQQSLDGLAGQPAAWIDVPYSDDAKEDKSPAGSRYRLAEAKVIASYLKHWMDCPGAKPEGKKPLSFGVITFYSQQVKEICNALETVGMAEKRRIKDEYAKFPDGGSTPRLKIGTVDSFQGMEFDVVILSMVRTTPSFRYAPGKRVSGMSLFGHLTSENRLCVSLSRQKKVLIVAGDSAMLRSDIARASVPGLVNFLKMCEDAGMVLKEIPGQEEA